MIAVRSSDPVGRPNQSNAGRLKKDSKYSAFTSQIVPANMIEREYLEQVRYVIDPCRRSFLQAYEMEGRSRQVRN